VPAQDKSTGNLQAFSVSDGDADPSSCAHSDSFPLSFLAGDVAMTTLARSR
jgi:hypothetical protein